MTTFRVIWEIDVDADNAVEAAKEAIKIQRDNDSTATAFDVINSKTLQKYYIDFRGAVK